MDKEKLSSSVTLLALIVKRLTDWKVSLFANYPRVLISLRTRTHVTGILYGVSVVQL
jgi:hypothetical protein